MHSQGWESLTKIYSLFRTLFKNPTFSGNFIWYSVTYIFQSLKFWFLREKYISIFIIFLIPSNGILFLFMGFPCGSAGQESACNAGNLGLIPGLGRSPGVGKDYTLQYFGLENSMGCTVQRVAKSQTRLRDFHFHSTHALYSIAFLGDIRKVLSLNSNTWWQKAGIQGFYVGIGNPLQYSCLENPMGRGGW